MKVGRVNRFGDEKKPQQKTHGENIEDSLNNHCSQHKPFSHVFLLGKVKRLDQLPYSTRKDEGDRKTDGIGRETVEQAGAFFLGFEKIFPSDGTSQEVNRDEDDNKDEELEVDICEVG